MRCFVLWAVGMNETIGVGRGARKGRGCSSGGGGLLYDNMLCAVAVGLRLPHRVKQKQAGRVSPPCLGSLVAAAERAYSYWLLLLRKLVTPFTRWPSLRSLDQYSQ